MIAEAVDTLLTLGWAVLAWLTVGALAAAVGLLATIAAAVVPPYAACRAVTGALAAERALRAWQAHPDWYRPPQRPAWAAA